MNGIDLVNDNTIKCNLFSNFIDNNIGHVVTGNVDFVSNKKLRVYSRKVITILNRHFKNKDAIIKSLKSDINSRRNPPKAEGTQKTPAHRSGGR